MSEPVHIIQCSDIGTSRMSGIRLVEKTQCDGVTKYWHAQCDVAIFGHDCHATADGYGRTKEEAIKRMNDDQHKLSESLWD